MTLPELRAVSARVFIGAIERDGFFLSRVNGSHHVYRHRDGRRIVVAYHALGDTFRAGTLRNLVRGLGWTTTDLFRVGLLRDRGETPRRAA
jgi:predicted RNA binding protein YcfA (HicA-like mRNA interferase family)